MYSGKVPHVFFRKNPKFYSNSIYMEAWLWTSSWNNIHVLTVWSMFGAFIERIFLMRGWNVYFWRKLEFCVLGALSRKFLTTYFRIFP